MDNMNNPNRFNVITNKLYKVRTNTLKNKLNDFKQNIQLHDPKSSSYMKHINKVIKLANTISQRSKETEHYHLNRVHHLQKKLKKTDNLVHRFILHKRIESHKENALLANHEHEHYKQLIDEIGKHLRSSYL